jgi:hypothetical protein
LKSLYRTRSAARPWRRTTAGLFILGCIASPLNRHIASPCRCAIVSRLRPTTPCCCPFCLNFQISQGPECEDSVCLEFSRRLDHLGHRRVYDLGQVFASRTSTLTFFTSESHALWRLHTLSGGDFGVQQPAQHRLAPSIAPPRPGARAPWPHPVPARSSIRSIVINSAGFRRPVDSFHRSSPV